MSAVIRFDVLKPKALATKVLASVILVLLMLAKSSVPSVLSVTPAFKLATWVRGVTFTPETVVPEKFNTASKVFKVLVVLLASSKWVGLSALVVSLS